MKTKCSKVEFTEYDFMKLFFATLVNKKSTTFDRRRICYELYPFKDREEYRNLFQDIVVRQQIEGNFLSLENAIQNAALFGLISSFGDKRFVVLTPEESTSIIERYGQEYSSMMDSMVDEHLKSKVSNKEKYKKLVK